MQNIKINEYNKENLENLSEIFKKDKSSIVNEALEEYFLNTQKKLLEKKLADENALTNLDFDEFWENVKI